MVRAAVCATAPSLKCQNPVRRSGFSPVSIPAEGLEHKTPNTFNYPILYRRLSYACATGTHGTPVPAPGTLMPIRTFVYSRPEYTRGDRRGGRGLERDLGRCTDTAQPGDDHVYEGSRHLLLGHNVPGRNLQAKTGAVRRDAACAEVGAPHKLSKSKATGGNAPNDKRTPKFRMPFLPHDLRRIPERLLP